MRIALTFALLMLLITKWAICGFLARESKRTLMKWFFITLLLSEVIFVVGNLAISLSE